MPVKMRFGAVCGALIGYMSALAVWPTALPADALAGEAATSRSPVHATALGTAPIFTIFHDAAPTEHCSYGDAGS